MKNILTVYDIKEFEIDLTGTCNLKCPLCTRNYKHGEQLIVKNIRPVNDIINQLDIFKNLERIMIAGAVSEPTLYPYLFELLMYLNSRNIHIEIFTNGDLHNNIYWEEFGNIIKNGNIRNKVIFTICGTTQEIHSKYRINSSLNNILNNANAFRTHCNLDHLQKIRFQYNKDDIISDKMKEIENKFNNSFLVDSEGIRTLIDFTNIPEDDIKPITKRDNAIKGLFKKKFPMKENSELDCESFNSGKLHINQFGQIHYCYISIEFPESKDIFLLNDPLELTINSVFDFTKVFNLEFPNCFVCEKSTKKLIEISNLDFVC